MRTRRTTSSGRRATCGRTSRSIQPAVMTVGGWFDAEDLFGALETYKSVEKQSPGATNTLVMGPWFHGGWSRSEGDHLGARAVRRGDVRYYRESIELPFFRRYLKGSTDAAPAESAGVRDRAATSGTRCRPGRRPASRRHAVLPCGRAPLVRPARGGRRLGLLRERPAAAGPVHRGRADQDEPRVHGGGTSGSRRAVPTCSCTRRRRSRTT